MPSKYLRARAPAFSSSQTQPKSQDDTPTSSNTAAQPLTPGRQNIHKEVIAAEQASTTANHSGELSEEKIVKLVPAARRNYNLYLKIDRKRFLTDADYNKVCMIACGDTRRIFQRILMSVYQRAHIAKDDEEVKRARLLLSLHERGELFKNLDVLA